MGSAHKIVITEILFKPDAVIDSYVARGLMACRAVRLRPLHSTSHDYTIQAVECLMKIGSCVLRELCGYHSLASTPPKNDNLLNWLEQHSSVSIKISTVGDFISPDIIGALKLPLGVFRWIIKAIRDAGTTQHVNDLQNRELVRLALP